MKKVLYFLITILLFSCKVNGQIGTVKTEEYKAEFEKKQSMTVVSDYTDTIVIPIQVLQIGINETVYEMYLGRILFLVYTLIISFGLKWGLCVSYFP